MSCEWWSVTIHTFNPETFALFGWWLSPLINTRETPYCVLASAPYPLNYRAPTKTYDRRGNPESRLLDHGRKAACILHDIHCVKCRRLRGKLQNKQLPIYLKIGWPSVSHLLMLAWTCLFNCLNCGAVHIELIEVMATASFINAMRRLYAIRGEMREFMSDRGTNFFGATDALQMGADH